MHRSTKDAAGLLGIAPSTLENWRSQGKGPKFLKLGDRVLYADRDLNEYLDSCRRSSTAVQTVQKRKR